jgi:predicted transcriptional regulator
MNHAQQSSLHKLLGELEVRVMERLWQLGPSAEATVREVAQALEQERERDDRPSVAYTTVMTVMSHLADKGLLTRIPLDKKTYLYRVALSREEFLERASQQLVDTLVADFGDLALAQFVEAVDQVDPARLEGLLERVRHLKATRTAPGQTKQARTGRPTGRAGGRASGLAQEGDHLSDEEVRG